MVNIRRFGWVFDCHLWSFWLSNLMVFLGYWFSPIYIDYFPKSICFSAYIYIYIYNYIHMYIYIYIYIYLYLYLNYIITQIMWQVKLFSEVLFAGKISLVGQPIALLQIFLTKRPDHQTCMASYWRWPTLAFKSWNRYSTSGNLT